jgi:hypothetical protein
MTIASRFTSHEVFKGSSDTHGSSRWSSSLLLLPSVAKPFGAGALVAHIRGAVFSLPDYRKGGIYASSLLGVHQIPSNLLDPISPAHLALLGWVGAEEEPIEQRLCRD